MDVNDLSMRVVKLKKKRKGLVVVSFNEVQIKHGIVKEGVIQDQETFIKTIALACRAVKGEKLDTKYVIFSLPEEKSFSQVIQMPKMTQEELTTAVPFEAENYIPLTIDKVYLDFQTINLHKDNANHLDLLINAIPKSIIDSYVYCFKQAGLIPCILEVESQAIVRALIKKGETTLPVIFIDFGQTKTSFLIFSDDSIRFTSSIPISSEQLTKAICKSFSINFNKAEELKITHGLTEEAERKYNIAEAVKPILNDLATQVKKYISFYHGHASHEYLLSNKNIAKVILCGGGSNLKGLPGFLAKELNIPVEVGDPFINIIQKKRKDDTVINRQKALSFTTALGLALRGVSDEM